MDNVDVNFRNIENLVPPLIFAVFMNNYEAVALLEFSPRIDVNVQECSSGHTALHFAAQSNKIDFVKLLLSSPRINREIKNKAHQTPADITQNSEIKLLLKPPNHKT